MNQISKLGTRHEARGTRNEARGTSTRHGERARARARERGTGTSTRYEHEHEHGNGNAARGTPFREGKTLHGLQEPEFSESTLQFLSLPPSFFHPKSCSCSCSMKWCSFSSSNTQGEKNGGFFRARARARGTGHGEHLFVREVPFTGCRSQSSPKAPCNSCRSRPRSFTPNRARARAQ